MKITFRLECPHCKWGHEWRNDFVNMGWLELFCNHCDKSFFAKISIPEVKVETSPNIPDDVPIQSEPKIEIVEAGVDSDHQTDHCDWCGVKFEHSLDDDKYEGIRTCTHTEYVTLCEKCYRNAGNKVR